MEMTEITRECKKCGCEITFDVEHLPELVGCDGCGEVYRPEPDADYVDGMWRDLTTLVPV